MTVQVNVRGSRKLLAELRSLPEEVEKALVTGLIRTQKGTTGPRGIVAKLITKEYKIRGRDVAATMKTNFFRRKLRMVISLKSNVVGLDKFATKAKRVRVKVKKKNRPFGLRHAFRLGSAKTGPIFERGRQPKDKNKLFRKFTTAISSTVRSNADVLQPIIEEKLDKEITSALERKIRNLIK